MKTKILIISNLLLVVLTGTLHAQSWLLDGNPSTGPNGLTSSNNNLGSESGNSVDINIVTNGNTVMTLTTGQNVGIGTDNPEHLLHVAGDANVDTTQVYRIDSLEALDARGIENIFVGMQTFASNMDTAAYNTFAGVDAGVSLTGGIHNTALGWSSGQNITLGYRNAMV